MERGRTAFTLSEIIPERIRRFREDRVTSILTNSDLPVNLVEGGRIVLHVIPHVKDLSNDRFE